MQRSGGGAASVHPIRTADRFALRTSGGQGTVMVGAEKHAQAADGSCANMVLHKSNDPVLDISGQ